MPTIGQLSLGAIVGGKNDSQVLAQNNLAIKY